MGNSYGNYEKVIILNRAASPAGLEIAVLLASRGYRVYALTRRLGGVGTLDDLVNKNSLSHLVTTIHLEGDGENYAAALEKVKVEIMDREAEKFYEDNAPELILINNSSDYRMRAALEELSREQLAREMERNFLYSLDFFKPYLPLLRQQGKGRLIQITGYMGRIGFPLHVADAASLFALEGMMESLRQELMPFGIFVSIVEPGPQLDESDGPDFKPDKDSPYKSMHSSLERFDTRLEKWHVTPRETAEVVLSACRSGNPLLRYQAGPAGFLARVVSSLLPQALMDGVYRML